MDIRIVDAPDAISLAKVASVYFKGLLERTKKPLVTLPTGETPLPFYGELRELHDSGQIGPNAFNLVMLDEYCGLKKGDKRLFAKWLEREVLDPLGIQLRLTFRSHAANPEKEIERFKRLYQQYAPIDIAVLGLGGNGHVAFNEPGSRFNSTIR